MALLHKDKQAVTDFLEEIFVLIVVIMVISITLGNIYYIHRDIDSLEKGIAITKECDHIANAILNWPRFTTPPTDSNNTYTHRVTGVFYMSRIESLYNSQDHGSSIILANFTTIYRFAFKITIYNISKDRITTLREWAFLETTDFTNIKSESWAIKTKPVCVVNGTYGYMGQLKVLLCT